MLRTFKFGVLLATTFVIYFSKCVIEARADEPPSQIQMQWSADLEAIRTAATSIRWEVAAMSSRISHDFLNHVFAESIATPLREINEKASQTQAITEETSVGIFASSLWTLGIVAYIAGLAVVALFGIAWRYAG